MVKVHYVGTFTKRKLFDKSFAHFELNVWNGQLSKGWDICVLGMKVGEKSSF